MSRTVIVTPFGRAEQLAAACTLSDIRCDVVPVGSFSAIVLDDTSIAEGNDVAATISKLSGKHEVLMLARNDEQIDAGHFRSGIREADVPAGLALTNLPAEVEKLLLETIAPRDIDGHLDTSKMSKLEASKATMTPAREALARTALLWMVVAFLALVGIVASFIGVFTGSMVAWAGVVIAVITLGISIQRISRVLGAART
ncbi:hypothetical protein M3B11_06645 [Brevibacterium sp. p3-SID960]|uniref:hypothetical protein n=1 Tax=Brevibacterium sp. p3-SID960 TaxID=2916063 RepID=UPI0021A30C34|nr:hypothetical protein [Brevibacterium sp. p3-SID960]MCT1690633.1 hypothetical protein [Brevibacterium sp. p3-SID960]